MEITMVQITQIVTANASAFLLLMIIKLHMNKELKVARLMDVRILNIMINLTMFQCFFDTLVFWIDGKLFPMSIELNYIGNILYYIFNMSIAFCWPLFTEYKLNSSSIRLKKLALRLGIPLLLLTVLVASAPFNGFIFTITPQNTYLRSGWHFFIPTILIMFYIIYGTAHIYIDRKGKGKYMIFPAINFIIPITFAMLFQTFNYGVSLIFIGISIGLAGVYLSTQSESAYIDSLCGIYNRRYYNDYIRSHCNAKNRPVLTGVLIDMDNFKSINDRFGHDAGDEALIQFSSVLRKCVNKTGFAVRYGGDEFILIFPQPKETAQHAIEDIRTELDRLNTSGENPFRLAFSYGITELLADQSSSDFLKVLDTQMYEMKGNRK